MQSSSKQSRRDFLATSAVTTSALAAGLSLSRSVRAAGSDQFKIALIGSGGRGTGAAADSMRVAKHIFMEKPCCVDAGGFRSLMETNELAESA